MGGGEDVEAAFGGGKHVEGDSGGVDELGQDFGGDRFAGGGGSDEVEDGVVVEGFVLGRFHGGENPVEEGLPGGVVPGLVDAQEFAEVGESGFGVGGRLGGFGGGGFGTRAGGGGV